MIQFHAKICGLTNPDDARAAIGAGADALGFNFWPGSKRYLEPVGALPWIAALPAGVTRVAVLVDPEFADALRLAETPGIDALQLHGAETPEFCARLSGAGHRLLKAVRGQDPAALRAALRFPPEIPLLLDADQPGEPGGTGSTIDWDAAASFVRDHPERPIFLAGGLTPENVTNAIRRVRPFGVDVATGVEIPGQPRRKDPSRLRAFLEAIRTLESELNRGPGENSLTPY